MRIARGQPDDARPLAEFARSAFLAAYGGNDPSEHVLRYVNEAFTEKSLEADLRDADTTVLLARPGDSAQRGADCMVGYVTLRNQRPIDGIAEPSPVQLERIYVDAAHHGGGVGSRLIEAAIATIASAGGGTIWLSVWQENLRAQKFYTRHGFERVGETFFMMGPVREDDFVYARRADDTR